MKDIKVTEKMIGKCVLVYRGSYHYIKAMKIREFYNGKPCGLEVSIDDHDTTNVNIDSCGMWWYDDNIIKNAVIISESKFNKLYKFARNVIDKTKELQLLNREWLKG